MRMSNTHQVTSLVKLSVVDINTLVDRVWCLYMAGNVCLELGWVFILE